jgi:PAS domain S-box-containing protein
MQGTLGESGRVRDGGRRLRNHFLQLLLCAGVPIIALVVGLGWRDYTRASQDIIEEHQRAQQVRQAGLEQIAGSVRTHVSVMRGYLESRLRQRSALPPYRGRVDWLPAAADPGADRGLVLSPPGAITADQGQDLTAIEPLFALSRATHAEHPYLRWSYYFPATRNYAVIYPWANPASMVSVDDPVASLASYFTYDVFTLGEPARNPGRIPYWTPVYLDAGGAGLMVSHAAPIWDGDRFLGIVGTDLLLSYLSDYLAKFPPIAGRAVVIDQAGFVVASGSTKQDGATALGDKPIQARILLGFDPMTPTGGAFLRRGSDLVSVVPVAGTSWQLVMTIPDSSIRAAIGARILPHALMLAGILTTFLLFAYLFRSQFVRPAVLLAEYGALPALEAAATTPPVVPRAWHDLRDRLRAAVNDQVALLHQLRAMIDGIPLRAVYVDHTYRYRDANREFLAFVGKTKEELLGLRVADVLGENVQAQYLGLTPQIRRGEVARFEGWIGYDGRGERYLQVSILPFTALGESEPGFLTFTRDLTELKQAEQDAAKSIQALAASEALHRSIIVSSIDAIIVIDEEGITREFNPAAEAIFGYSALEAIGRPVGDLIVPIKMRNAHHQGMKTYLATGIARVIGKRIEVDAVHKDGSLLPVELTVTEVTMAGRRLFTSHIRDLREPKRLAQELEQGRNRLHQVEKLSAMGSLLAGVAHELNNPLAIVIAQSALLAEKAQDEDMKRRGERIRAAADRCGRIVKSFLAMARQKPPQRNPVDLNEIVRSSLEMVGYGLRSAGIDVILQLDPVLPPVLADADLISQVVSNLVINAQHALLERPLPRQITITSEQRAGRVVLSIADNGPGVAPDIANRIFDPYFTTKSAGVGTGIGLSISRNIIDAHGGDITLLDRPGGGAVLQIRLPVQMPEGPERQSGAVARIDQNCLDILIVDDEPDVGQSLAEMLELLGHRTTVLTNSAMALEHVAQHKTDVLFTDLRMPGLDGVGLIDRLTVRHPLLARRSIIVTGDSLASSTRLSNLPRTAMLPRLESMQGAEVVMIEKPFGLEDIRAALAKVIAFV